MYQDALEGTKNKGNIPVIFDAKPPQWEKELSTLRSDLKHLHLQIRASVLSKQELPLSYAQQRLWFLEQLNPGSSVYNSCEALRLQGTLNIAAIEGAFHVIVQHHEILRTAFLEKNGIPQQKILAQLRLPFAVIDLENLSPDTGIELARQLILEAAHQPFDLTRPPLLRIALLRLAPDDHVLMLVIHHIIFDAWSWGVLTNDLMLAYTAINENSVPHVLELPIQYVDFAIWQKTHLQGSYLQHHLSYWTQQLRHFKLLQLTTDYPRPARQTFHGALHTFMIPPDLLNSLKKLCMQASITLYMLLLAAFQILLYRYTDQTDIIIGTDIANRTQKELEKLIGFFVNVLPLRVNINTTSSFSEFLKQVQQITLEAYEHQDLPFEKLVEALQVKPDPSSPPLVSVLFVFQNIPFSGLNIQGLQATPLSIHSDVVRFDLALFFEEQEKSCSGIFNYNTDLFREETIVRMTSSFLKLLQSIVDQPDSCIHDLEYLTEEEKLQRMQEKQQRQTSHTTRLKATRRKAFQHP